MDINDKIKVYTEIFHLINMEEINEFIGYYDIWALRDAIKISPLLLSSTKKYVPDKDREKKDNKISDICREIIHLFEMDDVNKFIKKYTIWGLRHALKIMPLIIRYTNQIDISSEKGKEIVDENLSDIYKEINIFLKNKKIMIFIDKFGIAGLKHTLEINHLLSKYTQNLNISSNRDKEQDDGYLSDSPYNLSNYSSDDYSDDNPNLSDYSFDDYFDDKSDDCSGKCSKLKKNK